MTENGKGRISDTENNKGRRKGGIGRRREKKKREREKKWEGEKREKNG